MSDTTKSTAAENAATDGHDDALAALFRQAARRPKPSPQHEKAARQAVFLEWRETVSARKRRRGLIYSLAASMAIAAVILGALGNFWTADGGTELTASVARTIGKVTVMPASGDSDAMSAAGIMVGQTLRTEHASGMSLAWANGGSLRLDQDTQIRVESRDEIYLQSGRVYFDSKPVTLAGNAGAANFDLSIRTDGGTVTPVGTRYQAAIVDRDLVVMVREGVVSVESDQVLEQASASEQLLVSASGIVTRSRIDTYGSAWSWVERTTPEFRADGSSILLFLQWVGRETGMQLQFDSEETQRIVTSAKIVGYGSLDVAPSEAMAVVMPSTGLRWKIRNGTIHIER